VFSGIAGESSSSKITVSARRALPGHVRHDREVSSPSLSDRIRGNVQPIRRAREDERRLGETSSASGVADLLRNIIVVASVMSARQSRF
jgi:hypothetical protein